MVINACFMYRPIELELPSINECIVIDNLEIFQKNGFDFEIDLNGKGFGTLCTILQTNFNCSFHLFYFIAEPTKRVRLAKIPYSKNWEFGKSDVDELIFMMDVRLVFLSILFKF